MRNLVATAIVLASSAAMAQQGEGSWGNRMIDKLERSYVFAGIGFGNYSQELGDFTDTGFSWQARLGARPNNYLSGEIQYQGLSSSVASVVSNGQLISGGTLTQTQFTGNMTLGAPITVAERELLPYALVGAGYARLSADRQAKNVGLDDDNTFALPVGVGVSYDLTKNFVIDGRFSYNILFDVDQPIANDDGDAWNLAINVGGQFGG